MHTRFVTLTTHVRIGSLAATAWSNGDVRFTPNSGHSPTRSGCLLWATTGLMRCSKQDTYSITSSARPSSGSGTVRPSALAVFKFTISSTLVNSWTGRSPGFSPFKIRPT